LVRDPRGWVPPPGRRPVVMGGAMIFAAAASALLLAVPASPSLSPSPSPTPTPAPAASAAPSLPARPGDVDTIEHVVAALYEVISGPAGPRDWDRFRSLFHRDARLIPSNRRPDGTIDGRAITAEGYI